MIFSYAQYIEYLEYIKSFHTLRTFSNWQNQPCILLRHDIDFSVEMAYKLAQIEHKSESVSTYFFLVTGKTYNVLSHENQLKLRWINEHGFEIGLHFDPTLYPIDDLELLEKYARAEASILELIIGKKIHSLSLHNPSIHNQYPMFPSFINAYDKKIFTEDTYISDSCKSFRGKDPFRFVENKEDKTLQILLHPMHFQEEDLSYSDILKKDIYNYVDDVHAMFLPNRSYKKEARTHLKNKL